MQVLVERFATAHRESQRAFNEGDFETAFAALAPDVNYRPLSWGFDASRLTGRDAVVRYFSDATRTTGLRIESQEFVTAGEGRVLVRLRRGIAKRASTIPEARHRAQVSVGAAATITFFQLWEIGNDGLVVRVDEYMRRKDAVEAAGLATSTPGPVTFLLPAA